MILSNHEIHKALDDGRLVIQPEPLPRKPTPGLGKNYCPYNTSSVDLRLGYKIAVPKRGAFAYDFQDSVDIAETISNNCEIIELSPSHSYKLLPGGFVLALTLEKIALPTNHSPPYLGARIEGRSSRARVGIIIHCTAPTVHPNWSGHLTLEMANLGPSTFLLSPEMPIAQLIIEQVEGRIIQNQSDFHEQGNPTGVK